MKYDRYIGKDAEKLLAQPFKKFIECIWHGDEVQQRLMFQIGDKLYHGYLEDAEDNEDDLIFVLVEQ